MMCTVRIIGQSRLGAWGPIQRVNVGVADGKRVVQTVNLVWAAMQGKGDASKAGGAGQDKHCHVFMSFQTKKCEQGHRRGPNGVHDPLNSCQV
mmetsp:Transcript_4894/g.8938  ORF Transcript_4894/g.8938 Transcript_4894/m.8938 type:complete len:93 (+) Transcript_4894:4222-4500(+)